MITDILTSLPGVGGTTRPGAAGSAASARFAEGILGKHFVVPALRPGPSLVLRMLNRMRGSRSANAGEGASVPLRSVIPRAARPGLGVEPAPDAQAATGRPGLPAVRMADLSRPALAFGPRLLVQRKPLVTATDQAGAVAVTRMTPYPQSVGASEAGRSTTPVAVPRVDRRLASAGHVPVLFSDPGLSADLGRQVGQRVSTRAGAGTSPRVMGTAHATHRFPGAPVTSGLVASTTLQFVRAEAMHRVSLEAQRSVPPSVSPLQSPLRRSLAAVAGNAPSPFTAAPLVSMPPASDGIGAAFHGDSIREVAPIPRLTLPGSHRRVQRKLHAAGPGNGDPMGVRRGSAAAAAVRLQATSKAASMVPSSAGLQPSINPRPMQATLLNPRRVAQPMLSAELPALRRPMLAAAGGTFAVAPSVSASPVSGDMGTVLRGSPERQVGQFFDVVPAVLHRLARRELPAFGIDNRQLADARSSPVAPMRSAKASGSAAPGVDKVELSLRRDPAMAAATPAVVSAALVANPPPVAGADDHASGATAQAYPPPMPIQVLADRVFSILERRLVVERERRGIRP